MTDAAKTLEALYNNEINFSISVFWDSGYTWKLGDDMNGFKAEGNADTFDEAVRALTDAAGKQWPHSAYADPDGKFRHLRGPSVGDAGLPADRT